jgi:hypothetical protein
VEAHSELEKEGLKPPAIGLFYDTSILQWNGSNADGGNYHVDLTTERGRAWFYAAIRDFFRRIPPAKWARIDGRPIIFLYEAAFYGALWPFCSSGMPEPLSCMVMMILLRVL